MLLRSASTGGFEVYDISNDQITGAASLGAVGLDFQGAGFGDFNRDGSTDMILRNRNTGQFEVYDLVNNQITTANNLGTIGLNFQVAGFAADSPAGSMGSADGSTPQLVQAMAGFGSGGADTSNIAPFGADTSQQTLLTTPQHA